MELKKNSFGKYRSNNKTLSGGIMKYTIITAIIISIIFLITTEQHWENVHGSRFSSFIGEFLKFWKVTPSQYLEITLSLIVTFIIAVSITILSIFIGLPLALLASKNLFSNTQSNIVKTFASIFRSVPTIIWAIIFIPVFGLTITTAIVSMAFHSVAFFVKSFSESFEEVDKGIIEAFESTGANKMKIITNALIPSTYKKLVSWVALRIEINLAVVIVIAPAVGIPNNIGYQIFTYYKGSAWAHLGLTLTLVVVSTLLLEMGLNKFKKRIDGHESN